MEENQDSKLVLLNIDSRDKLIEEYPVLYKYMSLENALKTLSDKYIWLANPTVWKDPFEKRFLIADYKDKNGKIIKFPFFNRTYAACMTRDEFNEAQWSEYSSGTIGIRFTINTKVLLDELDDFAKNHPTFSVFFGKVDYRKRSDIEKKSLSQISFNNPKTGLTNKLNSKDFCAKLLLLKRQDYTFENEMRIIVFKDAESNANGTKFKYGCRNSDLFPRLLISPYVEKETTKMLKFYLIQKQFEMENYKNSRGRTMPRVLKSHLYDDIDNVEIQI